MTSDVLEFAKKEYRTLDHIQFDILNEEGKEELQTIIAILFKESNI